MPSDYKPTTPRLKAEPSLVNPKILLGIGEKGGISVYGLQRFPVTLFFEQWEMLLGEHPTEGTIAAEIINMGVEHADLLAEPEARGDKAKADPVRTIGVTDAEKALVVAAYDKAKQAGDFDGAVKYATIKQAIDRTGKLPVEDMVEVYKLKAQ